MRYLLLLALVTVGCGDDPLRPSPPIDPPPLPTQAFCDEVIPGHEGFWLYVPERDQWIYVPPKGPTHQLVPCP